MPLRKTSGALWHDCWSTRLFAFRSRAGTEEAAFEMLVERYRRPLYGFLFRMVHDEAVAEELAEETFLRLHRSRDRSDGAEITTRLYRIAASLAIQHGQTNRAERAKVGGPSSAVTQQQETAAQKRVLAIRRHVAELPERQRLAVLLHKYQDFDSAQIAEVLTISESEANSLLREAYETLRLKLEELI